MPLPILGERQPNRHRSPFRRASPLARLFLKRLGVDAVTIPCKLVYIVDEHYADRRLRWHELAHLRQIQRMGSAKFWPCYYWQMITRGYARNRYEIEANAYRGRRHHRNH